MHLKKIVSTNNEVFVESGYTNISIETWIRNIKRRIRKERERERDYF